jgi:outer membrane protein assembly factor BamE (lipoprotein component of BamABCDE complex)
MMRTHGRPQKIKIMKIIYNILAITLAVVLLCGCASESISTATPNLSRALVDRGLINGKTTKADVIALLGKPQSTVSGSFGGVHVDTWAYAQALYHSAAAERGLGEALLHGMDNDRIDYCYLSITFGANGRVTGHMFGNSNRSAL